LIDKDKHIPVMINEVLEILDPQKGGLYVDATFGQGGYSKEILKKANCQLIALDRDHDSKLFSIPIKKQFGQNFNFFNERFSNIDLILNKINKSLINGIVFDLGTSSTQLNKSERGFSFNKSGPLDMRMGCQNDNKLTAELIVNEFSEKQLSDIFFNYGEERNSYKISKSIIQERKSKRILNTIQLKEIISKSGIKISNFKINPATKVFQALRIYVNNELKELEIALEKSIKYLKKNSKIIIISFHSLEDRIVKNFFKFNSGLIENTYKHLPSNIEFSNQKLKILTKKPKTASKTEVKYNPRSRSAKLRAAERI